MSQSLIPGLCQEDCEELSRECQRLKDVSLVKYAAKGHVDCVKAALAAGADWKTEVYYEDSMGLGYITSLPHEDGDLRLVTTLMEAARNGHVECVDLLIKSGADVNHEHSYGWTTLMPAAENGHLNSVQVLIKAGIDVNVGNAETCEIALQFAARNGHTECVKALIEAGADVNYEEGIPALILAAEEGHAECVKALLEAGAKDDQFKKASRKAERGGHEECVKLLKSAKKRKLSKN